MKPKRKQLMSFGLSQIDQSMLETVKNRLGLKSKSETLRKLILDEYSKKVDLSEVPQEGKMLHLKMIK